MRGKAGGRRRVFGQAALRKRACRVLRRELGAYVVSVSDPVSVSADAAAAEGDGCSAAPVCVSAARCDFSAQQSCALCGGGFRGAVCEGAAGSVDLYLLLCVRLSVFV